MHGEMADVDREEEESYLSAAEGKDRADSRLPEEENSLPGPDSGQDNDALTLETGNEKPQESEDAADFAQEELPYGGLPEGEVLSSDMADVEGAGTGEPSQNKNDLLRSVDSAMNESQENLDKLKVDRAELTQQDKQLRSQMLNHKRGSEEYRKLEIERAGIESQTAQIDKRIAMENGRLNQLRQQSRQLHTAMGVRSTPTDFDERRAEILRKRANISNFEQPEFKGVLSNAQMRDLYRKRAVANAAKAVVGTGGAVALGVISGGAAVFLGPSATILSSAAGMQAGGSAGELAVDASIGAGRIAKAGGKRIYQAADMAASAYVMNKIRPIAMRVPFQTDDGSATGSEEEVPIVDKEEIENTDGTGARSVQQIQADAFYAVQDILSVEGTMKNSTALIYFLLR